MGKTSLVTALRDDSNRIYAIVDEDGQTIPHGATEAPARLITADQVVTASDNKGVLTNITANARNITIPADLPKGFSISLLQMAAGTVSAIGAAGVTINSKGNFTKTNGAGSLITVTNTGQDNKYVLTGDAAV